MESFKGFDHNVWNIYGLLNVNVCTGYFPRTSSSDEIM